MKKLIIQIPCLNEADTLASTLHDLPRAIAGIDAIEVLVIDDGSTDATVDVARAAGVEHIISLRNRRGLATAFTTGIDTALKLGADFIVNTDGDNQYVGADIAALVAPLVTGEADVVIGDRNVETLRHLSWTRKRLQHLGSWVVRQVSNTRVPDTTSGFRAYSREAALRMNIVSEFTYTLESIIQAGKKRMAIAHVPIRSNPKTRPSRLFDNVWVYIKRSASTIVRIYTMYEPFKVFTTIGLLTFGVGLAISCRFLYFYLNNDGSGHVQSLLLAAVLMIVGFQVLMIGLVADVISANRKLLEDLLYRVRSMELDKPDTSHAKTERRKNVSEEHSIERTLRRLRLCGEIQRHSLIHQLPIFRLSNPGHHIPNRQARREARRLDPGDLNDIRILDVALDEEICKFLVWAVELRANTGAARLQVGKGDVRKQRARRLEKGVERQPRALIVVFRILILGGRTDEHAAPCRAREMHAQAGSIGVRKRVHKAVHPAALRCGELGVLSPARRDVKSSCAEHRGNLVGVQPGGIDDGLRQKSLVWGDELDAAVRRRRVHDGGADHHRDVEVAAEPPQRGDERFGFDDARIR